MNIFEYKQILLSNTSSGYGSNATYLSTDRLTELGSEGWELIAVTNKSYDGSVCLLKRVVDEEEQARRSTALEAERLRVIEQEKKWRAEEAALLSFAKKARIGDTYTIEGVEFTVEEITGDKVSLSPPDRSCWRMVYISSIPAKSN
jgi:hypothetical protein